MLCAETCDELLLESSSSSLSSVARLRGANRRRIVEFQWIFTALSVLRECRSGTGRWADQGAPAGQQLGNLGPLVAETLVRLADDLLLSLRPRRLFDVRVQMVVPSGKQN